MSKIVINAITHKDSCLFGVDDESIDLYEDRVNHYFAYLAEEAAKAGIGFDVDWQGQGPQSYRVVDEKDEGDYNMAHAFMQWDVKHFWEWL